MFTTVERENFAVHGLLKRRNFLPLEKLANARKVIFQQLEQASGVMAIGRLTNTHHQLSLRQVWRCSNPFGVIQQ